MKKIVPTLAQEEKIWRQGKSLIGVDEVGRGPLAGPVVACAVVIEGTADDLLALGVADSKTISPKRRAAIFLKLTHHPQVRWALGIVDETTIDETNILRASLEAMRQAVVELAQNMPQEKTVYVDGREIIPELIMDQHAIIGGDAKIFSIAAASIIAKVTRDAMMLRYDREYPAYQFAKHKGYGTKLHFELIKKHGMSPLHRRSFLKRI